MSAAEFIRISTRLSHWESTLSCTFEGRWVDTSRWSPNLRPSPAIRTACSVERTVSGSLLVAGQTLWASSITHSVGRRRSRSSHSCASTASATAARSRSTWMLPRSMTSARQSSSPSRSSSPDSRSSRDQIDHSRRPRLRIAQAERSLLGRRVPHRLLQLGGGRPRGLPLDNCQQRGVFVTVAQRVELGHRGAAAGAKVEEPHVEPAGAGAP